MGRPERIALCALTMLAVLVSACGSGDARPGSSSASVGTTAVGSDVAAVKAALVAEFGKGTATQATADCVSTRVTERVAVQELAAIGVTDKGLDLSQLGPKSVNLEPATVTFWDSVFECVPELADIGTLNPGSDAAIGECLRHSIVDDKLLRLALVFGNKKDSKTPTEFSTLESRFTDALAVCQRTAS